MGREMIGAYAQQELLLEALTGTMHSSVLPWWARRGVVLLSAPVLICVLKMQEKWSIRKSLSMQLRPLPTPAGTSNTADLAASSSELTGRKHVDFLQA